MLEFIQPDSAHLKEGWIQFRYYWVSPGNVRFRKKLGLADDCLTQTDPAAVGETSEILLNELQRRERETYGSASTLKWIHEFCSKSFLPQFAAVVTRMQSGEVEPRDSSISTPYHQMMAACRTLFPSQPVADDGSIKISHQGCTRPPVVGVDTWVGDMCHYLPSDDPEIMWTDTAQLFMQRMSFLFKIGGFESQLLRNVTPPFITEMHNRSLLAEDRGQGQWHDASYGQIR